MHDELLRRIEDLTDRIRQPRERRSEGATLVGRVISAIPPGDYQPAYWTVRPLDVGGSEAEGADVTYSDAGDAILGLHLTRPENGQVYLYRLVQGRWVADKSCLGCKVKVTVRNCASNAPVSGATVEIGGKSAVTNPSGIAEVTLSTPGEQVVVVTHPSYNTVTKEFDLDCGGEIEIKIGAGTACYRVAGCTYLGAGYTVTLSRTSPSPASNLASAVTDADGCAYFDLSEPWLIPGFYKAATVGGGRYGPAETTPAILNCTTNCTDCKLIVPPFDGARVLSLPPAGGYSCCGCTQPTSKTLTLTNKWGSITLNWTNPSENYWRGDQVISAEACTEYCCECNGGGGVGGPTYNPSVKTTASGPVTIKWRFSCVGLSAEFKAVAYRGINCGGFCIDSGSIFAADTIVRATEGCCNDPQSCTVGGGAGIGGPDEVEVNCEGVISYSWADVTFTTGESTPVVVSE